MKRKTDSGLSAKPRRPPLSIINRASLQRMARAALDARGVTRNLPRNGIGKLETYLTSLALKNVELWAAKIAETNTDTANQEKESML